VRACAEEVLDAVFDVALQELDVLIVAFLETDDEQQLRRALSGVSEIFV
jgi:hypothetical protein